MLQKYVLVCSIYQPRYLGVMSFCKYTFDLNFNLLNNIHIYGINGTKTVVIHFGLLLFEIVHFNEFRNNNLYPSLDLHVDKVRLLLNAVSATDHFDLCKIQQLL